MVKILAFDPVTYCLFHSKWKSLRYPSQNIVMAIYILNPQRATIAHVLKKYGAYREHYEHHKNHVFSTFFPSQLTQILVSLGLYSV